MWRQRTWRSRQPRCRTRAAGSRCLPSPVGCTLSVWLMRHSTAPPMLCRSPSRTRTRQHYQRYSPSRACCARRGAGCSSGESSRRRKRRCCTTHRYGPRSSLLLQTRALAPTRARVPRRATLPPPPPPRQLQARAAATVMSTAAATAMRAGAHSARRARSGGRRRIGRARRTRPPRGLAEARRRASGRSTSLSPTGSRTASTVWCCTRRSPTRRSAARRAPPPFRAPRHRGARGGSSSSATVVSASSAISTPTRSFCVSLHCSHHRRACRCCLSRTTRRWATAPSACSTTPRRETSGRLITWWPWPRAAASPTCIIFRRSACRATPRKAARRRSVLRQRSARRPRRAQPTCAASSRRRACKEAWVIQELTRARCAVQLLE
mmetsp:Transcript_69357/g.167742  ORF Transcript_69357/g.167742 Transcript_69357/m.167742 type:complete len:380 (+) Transcript_69357:359-1498(+)